MKQFWLDILSQRMTNDWLPSSQQETALQMVYDYCYRLSTEKPPFFYLGGYAGSGKTTLAKHFASVTPGAVVRFASYTGKAALVLQRKGCHNATTIDRLIYHHPSFWMCTRPNKCESAKICVDNRGLCQFAHKQYLPKHLNIDALDGVHMVIVDEVSMVGPEHGEDLLSFGVPILVLGDPGQLPPIAGTGFFTSDKPNLMLTEIHRQALDSPIIQMATCVREGRLLRFGEYGDSRVIDDRDLDIDMLMSFDQVLVGTNRTRVAINKAFRKKLGYDDDPLPNVGEILICLRNDSQKNILNGQLFTVEKVGKPRDGFVELDVSPRDDLDTKTVTVHARIDIFNNPTPQAITGTGQEFDYGYAITVHKSQGSEYDNVLVIDESYAFPEYQRRAHLYTAITRAAKRVTVARRKKTKR